MNTLTLGQFRSFLQAPRRGPYWFLLFGPDLWMQRRMAQLLTETLTQTFSLTKSSLFSLDAQTEWEALVRKLSTEDLWEASEAEKLWRFECQPECLRASEFGKVRPLLHRRCLHALFLTSTQEASWFQALQAGSPTPLLLLPSLSPKSPTAWKSWVEIEAWAHQLSLTPQEQAAWAALPGATRLLHAHLNVGERTPNPSMFSEIMRRQRLHEEEDLNLVRHWVNSFQHPSESESIDLLLKKKDFHWPLLAACLNRWLLRLPWDARKSQLKLRAQWSEILYEFEKSIKLEPWENSSIEHKRLTLHRIAQGLAQLQSSSTQRPT